MIHQSAPLVSRNFAIFLFAIAFLVMAAPFADQKGWQGLAASAVVALALVTMLSLWLRQFAENLFDWWRDDRESPF